MYFEESKAGKRLKNRLKCTLVNLARDSKEKLLRRSTAANCGEEADDGVDGKRKSSTTLHRPPMNAIWPS